jgi:antitoxin YefM
MKTVPLSEARTSFPRLSRKQTRHTEHRDHPARAPVGRDDLECLQETIHWLSQSGIPEDLAQVKRDITEGNMTSGDDLRGEFGLPPR